LIQINARAQPQHLLADMRRETRDTMWSKLGNDQGIPTARPRLSVRGAGFAVVERLDPFREEEAA
jgi:hypothetical protein